MRRRLVPSRRSLFCGFLVLAALGAIVSSALPGAGQGHVGDSGAYGQLVDVREYAGTGFGGEAAHCVRLDFSLSGSAAPTGPADTSTGGTTSGSTGSTTGSSTGTSTTGGTTGTSTSGSTGTSTTGSTTGSTAGSSTGGTTGGSTTGGTTGPPTGTAMAAKARPGGKGPGTVYRLHPRTWLFRRGGSPGPGEGATGRLTEAVFANAPRGFRVAAAARPAPSTSGDTGGTAPGTTGTQTTGSQTTGSTGTQTTGSTGTQTTGTQTTGSQTTGSQTTGGTTGGGGSSWYTTTSSATYFCVDASFFPALTVGGQHPGADYGGDGVAGYNVNRGNHFEFRLPGPATRNVWIVGVASGERYHSDAAGNTYDDGGWGSTVGYPTTLALSRRDTPAVSVDSRRVYGQPDLDGEVPADPNADLRNPSFYPWQYRGGLFVGVAQGQDQSGTARVQAYVPAGSFTYPLASSLTMLALGTPKNYATPVYGAFVPSSSDPNLATTPATATWANAWSLANATAVGSGDGMTPVPSGEYSRCFFAGDASKVVVALKDETQAGSWGYFVSAAYPLVTDGAPRTWTADRTATGQGFFHSY